MENKGLKSEINTLLILHLAFTTVFRVLTSEQRKRISFLLKLSGEKIEDKAEDEQMLNSAAVLRALAEAAKGDLDSSSYLLKNMRAAKKINEIFQTLPKDHLNGGSSENQT